MSPTSSSSSRIKGGGKAHLTKECRQSVISLLMRLAAPERDDVVATTSKHEQQRKEKKFVRQLVQRYERTRLQQTYNSAEDAVSYNDSAERRSVISVATGNVRLEIAEAIFISKKNDSKKKTKSKLPFQTGTRKVMVVSRSTTIDELCKQAKSKLHIKTAPTRAFVVQDSSSFAIFHLKNDLAGVEDGTTIYVTSAAKDSGRDEDKDCQSEELSSSTPEEDPLAQVKRAYATQERQRRIQRTLASSADTTPRIDADKAAQMAKQRSNLPAWACRSDILAASNVHSVVVLSGATGSGKSTQVPQFFWEQMREENDDSPRDNLRPRYIVVTQPRRVAAISLAQRVAEETGSASPGKRGSLVGYIVRLDRKVADETCRIIYCTVGVLLRMLVSPRGQRNGDSKDSLPPLSMDTISHVILDEVHERDVNTDFSLTLLRGLLASKRYPQLRLILMSATASADFFVDYFASVTSAPPKSLEIPGRTFPVKVNWISDCEKFSGARCQKSDRGLSSRETSDESSLSLSPRAYQKIDNILVRSLIGKIVLNQQSDGELKVSSAFARERSTGAILVFLPGKAEIDSLARSLYENKQLTGDRNICNILKLYSSMPRNEQQAVFQPARVGTVKIVLATNVAETSITIPDVSHVIDAGLVKESRYNSATRIKELVTVWTSQASAMQRSGRAGRMSEGICWRLFSEEFFNDVMIPQSAPEMVRTPLDELILQICLLFEQRRDENISKAETSLPLGVRPVQFLSKTPSPPPERSLLEGCRHLLEVDALHVVGASSNSTGEASYLYRLTPLGYHLSRLPMDTKVGKVLIVGCILGCLDGALTVAAALSCTKSCFCSLNPSNPENTAIVQHRSSLIENGFGGRSWAGGTVKGDLIAVIAAFRCWKKQESEGKRWKMVKSHGLDMTTLKDMDQLRSQFMQLLQDVGFVPKRSTASEMNSCLDLVLEDCNQSSEDALLTSCCLIGGLYPNICTLMRPRKGGPRGGRLLTKEGHVCRAQRNSFQSKRIQQAAEVGRDAYAVFHAKQKTIGTSNLSSSAPDIFLTEVNFVSRFALMLFGGELQIVKNAVIVDDWLKFKICSRDDDDDVKAIENAVLIFSLREALDKVIVEHIQEVNACREQKQVMMERHKAIVQVVRKLLSEE